MKIKVLQNPFARKYREAKSETLHPFEVDIRKVRDLSKGFKKLNKKIQVFQSSKPYITNRIIHSLEVAEESAEIAKKIGLNSLLAYLIGSLHDIGHNWGGHIGEEILNHTFPEINYNHNKQGLIVVKEIEKMQNAKFYGLNLTKATLYALNAKAKNGNKKIKINRQIRMDFDFKENTIYEYNILESILVKIIDLIVYIAHDIKDSFLLGYFDLEEISTIPVIDNYIWKTIGCQIKDKNYNEITDPLKIGDIIEKAIQNYFTDSIVRHCNKFFKSNINPQKIYYSNIPIQIMENDVKIQLQEIKKYMYKRIYHNENVIGERDQLISNVFRPILNRIMNDKNELKKLNMNKIFINKKQNDQDIVNVIWSLAESQILEHYYKYNRN